MHFVCAWTRSKQPGMASWAPQAPCSQQPAAPTAPTPSPPLYQVCERVASMGLTLEPATSSSGLQKGPPQTPGPRLDRHATPLTLDPSLAGTESATSRTAVPAAVETNWCEATLKTQEPCNPTGFCFQVLLFSQTVALKPLGSRLPTQPDEANLTVSGFVQRLLVWRKGLGLGTRALASGLETKACAVKKRRGGLVDFSKS